MSYHQRLSLLIMVDSAIVLTAIFFSRFLLEADLHVVTLPLVVSSITLLLSHHVFSMIYKMYKKAWEYASVGELVCIVKAVTLSIITTAFIQEMIVQDIYVRLLAVTWMVHILLIGGSRFCWRLIRGIYIKNDVNKKRTLIIGAGSAGMMVVRQLIKNHDVELLPVAFIDDNPNLQHLDILGIPVVGGIDQIEKAVEELHIDNIVIAIPSLGKKGLNNIFRECAKTSAKTQILPMLEDIVTGKLSVSQFRDVQVEDLLGREPIELDIDSISGYITQKRVLVTGAGGSIGSEICRQITRFHPSQLILLGHGENSIYSIEMELRDLCGNTDIKFVTEIADIQDAVKMMSIMNKYRPQVVYHAAAHKHVPLMERNPEEAVKNNVIGTLNVAKAASKFGVGTFVMISTDKAVNPTSVMGATKRLAEMIIQHMDMSSETKFVAVRFGNVLGSRGSVIPRFKQQIEKGGPVSVTHPDMIRYFMTIPEASRLVIQAGALAKGGEIFVLDMGEPVKIVDLARNLIKLSGHSTDDIEIVFTGIRPGEKLFEELLQANEVEERQVYPKIYIGKTSDLYIEEIRKVIASYTTLEGTALREQLLNLANGRVMPAPTKKLISIG
ncbi:polysaccharide biosynthesis protein [Paenibacillus sp. OAS669]|uniref:polysaccharide biosynthesis protein n=1 Tax=Paenibacillus sp. OAS669 TaxID=2663821 RepID=UPI00178C1293|nr:nucleoside-diphosphate sugar epimerase/dehydratase [Paenibacillus sp. OAS669]MBE1444710.1 FlaA1/EpsC-like NDP-sugar epimerase [Paenibacillus sp. OAS669]